MFVHRIKIILNFLYVCQSVCLLTSSPKSEKGIYPDLDEISFWNFLKTLLDIGTLVPNNSEIFCMSVSLAVGILP